MAKKQKGSAFPVITVTRSLIVAGVAIALLLLIIAIAVEVESLVYIGIFILPLMLLCGGLLLKDESTPTKVTLLVFSGLILMNVAMIAMIMTLSFF